MFSDRAGDVVQVLGCLPSTLEALGSVLSTTQPDVVVRTCDLSTSSLRVRSSSLYLQLYSELKASLGYMRPRSGENKQGE